MSEINAHVTSVLENILKEETGIEIHKAERDLITGIAKEMLQKNPELIQQFQQKTLSYQTERKIFKEHLLAATAVAMMIEMQELQKDCQRLLKKYMDPAIAKSDKALIKDKLKNVLGRLNRLDPSAQRREKMDALLNDDNFIDKLIQMKEDLQAEKNNPDSKIPTLDESKKLNQDLMQMFDKNLEDTLHNLYGCDPRIAGAIAFPVMVVIGDYVGIPDQFAAISSAANIHRLSGDLDAAGIDEHMTRIEKTMTNLENLYKLNELVMDDKLDDALHHASHITPTLKRE